MSKQKPTVQEVVGKAVYEASAQRIWAEYKNDVRVLVDLRGWGRIQNMFPSEVEAARFQDELGRFIADAINEKAQPADPKPYEGGKITPGRFVPESEIQKLREANRTGLVDDILDAVCEFLQAIEKGGSHA